MKCERIFIERGVEIDTLNEESEVRRQRSEVRRKRAEDVTQELRTKDQELRTRNQEPKLTENIEMSESGQSGFSRRAFMPTVGGLGVALPNKHRKKEFELLTDEEVASIEQIVRDEFEEFDD